MNARNLDVAIIHKTNTSLTVLNRLAHIRLVGSNSLHMSDFKADILTHGEFDASVFGFNDLGFFGRVFTDMLKARTSSFVERNSWDLKVHEGMEFDQYDTPYALYFAVWDYSGKVVGGLRLLPTASLHSSYMMLDAQLGSLPQIPSDLVTSDLPRDASVYEVTRLFIDKALSVSDRNTVKALLVQKLYSFAVEKNLSSYLAMLPSRSKMFFRDTPFSVSSIGSSWKSDGMKYSSFVISPDWL